jgi:glycosyltransferase involved in cell wall biosynthesis
MRECFQALRREGSLDPWLFKGGGPDGAREIALPHLPRAGFGARALGDLSRRGPYVVEQATFAMALVPYVERLRPHVVYYCDPSIGKLLWHWRRLRGERFRLLLHNGGPFAPPFRWCDHVHELTPGSADAALAAGHDPARQTMLPCGFEFGPVPIPPSTADRTAGRRALGLPDDRAVVLSVGALNRGHKRMDYLIHEVAWLPEPRPFLVMMGEVESETPAVRATADLLLGPDNYAMRTVPREELDPYYQTADVFALASLREAFGLAYVEAMAHGLPCVAHDAPVTRFVLGDEGIFADLARPGALAQAIRSALDLPDTRAARARRFHLVRTRFGWDELAPAYARMMRRGAATAQVRAG